MPSYLRSSCRDKPACPLYSSDRYWLPQHEKYFFPDLPDLDLPPYTPEITPEEFEYAQKVVDQDKEKKRRAKVLKEKGGG